MLQRRDTAGSAPSCMSSDLMKGLVGAAPVCLPIDCSIASSKRCSQAVHDPPPPPRRALCSLARCWLCWPWPAAWRPCPPRQWARRGASCCRWVGAASQPGRRPQPRLGARQTACCGRALYGALSYYASLINPPPLPCRDAAADPCQLLGQRGQLGSRPLHLHDPACVHRVVCDRFGPRAQRQRALLGARNVLLGAGKDRIYATHTSLGCPVVFVKLLPTFDAAQDVACHCHAMPCLVVADHDAC